MIRLEYRHIEGVEDVEDRDADPVRDWESANNADAWDELSAVLGEAACIARVSPMLVHCSDPSAVSAIVYGRPDAADYEVNVDAIAAPARFTMSPVSTGATLAGGTILFFRRDGGALPVLIDDEMSVDALAGRVNRAGIGVRASVCHGVERVTLTLSALHVSRNGALVDVRVTQHGNGEALEVAERRRPCRAALTVGDKQLYSDTNTFNDAIDGVEVRVQRTSDAPVSLSVRRDISYALVHLEEFDRLYGELRGDLRGSEPVDAPDAILEAATFGVVVSDMAGLVRYANGAYVEMVGLVESEVIGASSPWFSAARNGGETVATFVDRTVRGESRPLHGGGEQIGWATTCVDVTDRATADASHADVVAMMTHEFRTPLTSLRGFADLLLTRTYDVATQREFLGIIRMEAERLGDMVNDTLDLCRARGERAMSCEPVDLAAVAVEMRSTLRGLDGASRVKLDTEVGCPLAYGNERAVAQVVTNLVANALKYAPGDVVVSLFSSENRVLLQVQDGGGAIPADVLERVFEPYYRDPKARNKVSGSGLGLAIVKLLCDKMGAIVEVESTPEVGTIFTVSFEPVAHLMSSAA
ncbi:MAG: signal transduction histidine kinase [Bradymonadia bacterium]